MLLIEVLFDSGKKELLGTGTAYSSQQMDFWILTNPLYFSYFLKFSESLMTFGAKATLPDHDLSKAYFNMIEKPLLEKSDNDLVDSVN